MSTTLRITGEDLLELLEQLADEPDTLRDHDIEFKANARGSSHASAGLPELSELILTIGAAGGFTALATILSSYFRHRPKSKLTLHLDNLNDSITLHAENHSQADIEKTLARLLSSRQS